jgi:deoxyribonuclease IV
VRPFGFHLSINGGMTTSIERANQLEITALQIFAHNPRGWSGNLPSAEQTYAFREKRALSFLEVCIIHAIYLVNLASFSDDVFERSWQLLAKELLIASDCGIEYVVTHLGSSRGLGHDKGIERIISAFKNIESELDHQIEKVTLLLENGVGGGELLGSHMSDIKEVIEKNESSLKIGVCIDSAHAWASGYPINTEDGLDNMIGELGTAADKLCLLHLNDATYSLASHRDKHEHLGLGQIGYDGLALFLNHKKLQELPVIMETPKEGVRDDAGNREAFLKLISSDSQDK